jgi:hypothetical protein
MLPICRLLVRIVLGRYEDTHDFTVRNWSNANAIVRDHGGALVS